MEAFAVARCSPDALWALAGDLSRLPEWTEAEEVVDAPAIPGVGDRFTTRDGVTERNWVVITSGPHLLEAKTDHTACGRLGIGIRVVPDPLGARLVMAGLLDPQPPGTSEGGATRLRRTGVARLRDLPRLRTRLDRWTDKAVRGALG